MLRHRRLCASLVLALATIIPVLAQAETPTKPVVADSDDDAKDKEIERLYAEGKYDAAFALAEKLVAEREARTRCARSGHRA